MVLHCVKVQHDLQEPAYQFFVLFHYQSQCFIMLYNFLLATTMQWSTVAYDYFAYISPVAIVLHNNVHFAIDKYSVKYYSCL